jgi:hypothetical protein
MSGDVVDVGPFEADLLFRLTAGVPALRDLSRLARAAAAAGVPMRLQLLSGAAAPRIVTSVSEYASERGVSPRTVRRWISEGKLDAARTSSGWMVLR